jgi:hypothetical protein
LRWVAEKSFDDEAAADGVKEGGVGRGTESTRDVGGERGVFKIGDGRDCGAEGKSSDGWGRGKGNVQGIRGLMRREGWDVDSPHILTGCS